MKRGRPKKKPGYDRDKEIGKLIATAASLFGSPYDDRNGRSEDEPSLASVAKQMGTTPVRIRKLLITAGRYSTAKSRMVQKLYDEGNTTDEIVKKLDMSIASVKSYLPYHKGVYNLENPTLSAELQRVFKKRKKACEKLHIHLDKADREKYLWEAIMAFEGYRFPNRSASGYFHYEIRDGQELEINGVSFTKDAVMKDLERRESYISLRVASIIMKDWIALAHMSCIRSLCGLV